MVFLEWEIDIGIRLRVLLCLIEVNLRLNVLLLALVQKGRSLKDNI